MTAAEDDCISTDSEHSKRELFEKEPLESDARCQQFCCHESSSEEELRTWNFGSCDLDRVGLNSAMKSCEYANLANSNECRNHEELCKSGSTINHEKSCESISDEAFDVTIRSHSQNSDVFADPDMNQQSTMIQQSSGSLMSVDHVQELRRSRLTKQNGTLKLSSCDPSRHRLQPLPDLLLRQEPNGKYMASVNFY